MPVKVRKRGDKFRLVEPSGKIAKTPKGKPRDGGGHNSESKAKGQARSINSKTANFGIRG